MIGMVETTCFIDFAALHKMCSKTWLFPAPRCNPRALLATGLLSVYDLVHISVACCLRELGRKSVLAGR